MNPEEIDADTLRDADALVVRTRTRADEQLLAGSRVQLVCTATIGYDHIDTAWCESHGIHWTACSGCNAQAVCDYIEEVINTITNHQSPITNPPAIGIVGVGHVGSLVADMAARKGLRVLLNDPPKGIGVSLDEIARKSSIITFHVPLEPSTRHMCNDAFLRQCRPGTLVINASRGGVVDEIALLRHSKDPGRNISYVLDTWENEPDINREVLAHATLASMHIAGYSLAGKRNATQMCLDAIAEHFALPRLSVVMPDIASGDTAPGWIERITAQLRQNSDQFEHLRKSYPLR